MAKRTTGKKKTVAKKKMVSSKNTKKTQVLLKNNEQLPPTEGLPTNPTINTSFCNVCNIMFSNEQVAYLRWFTRLPGINLEQCRTVVPIQTLKSIMDICCKHLNYYPEKPKSKK